MGVKQDLDRIWTKLDPILVVLETLTCPYNLTPKDAFQKGECKNTIMIGILKNRQLKTPNNDSNKSIYINHALK